MAENESGPTDAQKKSLKGILKDAINEVIDEREEKRRTSGETVDTANQNGGTQDQGKPKSFFEALFG